MERDTIRQRAARIAFTLAFGGAGLAHFLFPRPFIALIPRRVPWRRLWVYASGIVELGVALGLATRPLRPYAAQGVFGLLLAFLPLHVIDLLRAKPVTVNKPLALLRLVAQFLLIALARDLARGVDGRR